MSSIVLVGPNGTSTGNQSTLCRLRLLFSGLGYPVVVLDAHSSTAVAELSSALPSARIVVALHGHHSGRLLRAVAFSAPLILILAGTDVNAPPDGGEVCAATAAGAAAVVGFSAAILERLAALCGGTAPPRSVCIPQAATLPLPLPAAPCVRGALGLSPGAPLAILVAGLRDVKDPLFALPAFAALHGRLAAAGVAPAMLPALLVVGPELDAGVAARVRTAAGAGAGAALHGGRGGVFVHPPVPRPQLLAWLEQADAALNTSRSEGQCVSLLEAMAVGTPVAARAVEGNRALVAHGATGLLFDTAEGAVNALEALLGLGAGARGEWPLPGRARPLRSAAARQMAGHALRYVRAHHSDAGEVAAWRELLAAVVAPGGGSGGKGGEGAGAQPAAPAPALPSYQRHALLRLPFAQRRASALVARALRWLGDHAGARLGPVVAPPPAALAAAASFAAGRARAWGAPGDLDDARWPAAPHMHDFSEAGAAAATASAVAGTRLAVLLSPPPHLAGLDGAPFARLGWGRFAEDRVIYTSSHFTGAEDGGRRSFHIGVDLEAPAGTPVLAPLPGRVHSVGVDTSELGYGPTVVLVHTLRVRSNEGAEEDVTFYTLYGHLSRSSVFCTDGAPRVAPGALVTTGAVVGEMGSPVGNENGGWWPHVHFQVMTELDMGGWQGDYPGVCAVDDWGAYSELMVDPNVILRCPWVAPVGWAPGAEEGGWLPRVVGVDVVA
jgi:murein DD-endopeptidase MepM/ murein hydrolase activator NlpD